MGSWLVEHASLAANIASLLMLLVWLFYTAIFYREFRRQRRPFLILHQGRGYDLDSTCLLVNLSKEPVHVSCVLMRLQMDRGLYTKRIRDFQQITPDSDLGSRDVQTLLKQGPLTSGGFLVLGTFRELLDAALEDASRTILGYTEGIGLNEFVGVLHEITFHAVVLHGAYDRPVGAARSFAVTATDSEARIRPTAPLTRQMNSSAQMREVAAWMTDCFPEPFEKGE